MIADQVVIDSPHFAPCREDWAFRNVRRQEADLAFFEVRQDSWDHVRKGDTVIVDRSCYRVEGSGFYVLQYTTGPVLCRVEVQLCGWRVSTSRAHWSEPEIVPREREHNIIVLGRLAWPRIA